MGNFYTNVTLRHAQAERVAEEMRALNRESYVFGAGDVCVVYDKQSEVQDTSILAALGEHLATRLNTVAVAVLNHDDDVLWLQVYRQSDLIAEYCNENGPPTNVRNLAEALGGSVPRLWFLLKRPFIFQIERHKALNEAFGFPEACLLGYTYIHRGERTDNMTAGSLIHVAG